MKRRAVFLDRDGVINQVFIRDGKARAPDRLDQFEFFPGVHEAVKALKQAGFLTIVVTNQPDVHRGWQKREIVDQMNDLVRRELEVDDVKVCFHVREHECACRKPKAGMLLESAIEWEIDLQNSFMIGDRFSDLQAGKLAGCKSILVGSGEGAEDESIERLTPAAQVSSLLEASEFILANKV